MNETELTNAHLRLHGHFVEALAVNRTNPALAAEKVLAAYLEFDNCRDPTKEPYSVDPAVCVLGALQDARLGRKNRLLQSTHIASQWRSEASSGSFGSRAMRKPPNWETDPAASAFIAVWRIRDELRADPFVADHHLLFPLDLLVDSLEEMLAGHQPPLLQPEKVSHCPGDSTFRQVIKALAIVSLDLLLKFGESLDRACRFVAPILTRSGFRIGSDRSQTPSWRVIRRWRERVSRLGEEVQERHTVIGLRGSLDSLQLTSLAEAHDHVRSKLELAIKVIDPVLT